MYSVGFYVSPKVLKYGKCKSSSIYFVRNKQSGARGLQVYGN